VLTFWRASTLLDSSPMRGYRAGGPSGDELSTASRQGEKTTASRDQTGQSGTDDGTWNTNPTTARLKFAEHGNPIQGAGGPCIDGLDDIARSDVNLGQYSSR
jgi:hypothetical protein